MDVVHIAETEDKKYLVTYLLEEDEFNEIRDKAIAQMEVDDGTIVDDSSHTPTAV